MGMWKSKMPTYVELHRYLRPMHDRLEALFNLYKNQNAPFEIIIEFQQVDITYEVHVSISLTELSILAACAREYTPNSRKYYALQSGTFRPIPCDEFGGYLAEMDANHPVKLILGEVSDAAWLPKELDRL